MRKVVPRGVILFLVLIASAYLLCVLLYRPVTSFSEQDNFNITVSCEGAQLSWPPIYVEPLVYTDADCTKRISCSATAMDGLLCFMGYIEGGTESLDTLYVRLPQLYQEIPLEGVSQPVSDLGKPLTLEDGSTLTFTSVTIAPPALVPRQTGATASAAFTCSSAEVFPSRFTLTLDGEVLEASYSALDGNSSGTVNFSLPESADGTPDNVRVAGGTIAVTALLVPISSDDLTLTCSDDAVTVVLLP